MLAAFSAETLQNPFPLYAAWRKQTPVQHDAQRNTWYLLDYESVRRAITDPEAYSSAIAGGIPGTWLLFNDPPRHTRLRALIHRAFTPRAVTRLEGRIRELCSRLLGAVVDRSEVDLVAEFSLPLPLMVIAELLGAPSADWQKLRRWSDAVLGLVSTLSGGDEAARAVAAFTAASTEMEPYLAELLQERRLAPSDDLLSGLVHAEIDGERLSERELLGFFQLLLLAGHETTTNLIANAVLCLLEKPAALAELRREPGLVPSAIEEVLRYRSPVQATFRLARRDVEIGGLHIPKGGFVVAVIGSANRDPRQFSDAEDFVIGRTPNPHLAFGHGIHFCVGAALSRLEAQIALQALLARATAIELAGPWQPRPAFHVHGPTSLPLRVTWHRR